MLFCHELIHNRNTLIKLHNRNTLINIKGERTWNNTVSYTEDCILLYHEIKPTCNFFPQEKKKNTIYSFQAFQWKYCSVLIAQAIKALYLQPWDFIVRMWELFFCNFRQAQAVFKPHYANSFHTSSTCLAFTYQWAGPCEINPFMWNTLIRNKKKKQNNRSVLY